MAHLVRELVRDMKYTFHVYMKRDHKFEGDQVPFSCRFQACHSEPQLYSTHSRGQILRLGIAAFRLSSDSSPLLASSSSLSLGSSSLSEVSLKIILGSSLEVSDLWNPRSSGSSSSRHTRSFEALELPTPLPDSCRCPSLCLRPSVFADHLSSLGCFVLSDYRTLVCQ